ncbi:MAG: AarF/UbiB family protein [Anaerolineae bacterium]|nr:AarF/UbiB family protein [Anaerolineae bacterium]MDW8070940.1 AarF/UbiB family protein [Anaerolineae bacterium]
MSPPAGQQWVGFDRQAPLSDRTGAVSSSPSYPVDWVRYLRVMRFFLSALFSIVWWDILLGNLPIVRHIAAQSAMQRWRALARRYRQLAVQLGGVLIKLGQFLSIRVDVLPAEVIAELADLQDEVPAEDISRIHATIAQEFGRPAETVFAWLAPIPEAAASLAQVHRARLRCPSPQVSQDDTNEVVVKVQRSGIRRIVETDLAAIRAAGRLLQLYPPIARRVDMDRLLNEFTNTTRAELDFIAEGKNAERFAQDFADDPHIVVPRIYWDYTTSRVLTMENVAAIKITDCAISPEQVARRVYRAYMYQIFITNFVHADPHPGNLFVRPIGGDERTPGAGEGQFQIIFVDFGMMAVVPERLRAQARELLLGLATRDARRIVQAYIDADVVLPDADRKRLEELHETLLKRLYGIKMNQLRYVAFREAQNLWRDYRDIIFEMPFQFPSDVLFVVRAIGILLGIVTSLNPEFDPWAETLPFAEQLASQELNRDWEYWLDRMLDMMRMMWMMPMRLDRLLTQAERGELATIASLAPNAERMLRRMERSLERLTWGVIFTSLLIAGMLLRLNEGPSWTSTALLAAAGLALLWGLTRR